MREIYFVACGIILGMSLRDWLERHERRVAYRAADIAEETLARRREWEAQNPDAVAPAATPA